MVTSAELQAQKDAIQQRISTINRTGVDPITNRYYGATGRERSGVISNLTKDYQQVHAQYLQAQLQERQQAALQEGVSEQELYRRGLTSSQIQQRVSGYTSGVRSEAQERGYLAAEKVRQQTQPPPLQTYRMADYRKPIVETVSPKPSGEYIEVLQPRMFHSEPMNIVASSTLPTVNKRTYRSNKTDYEQYEDEIPVYTGSPKTEFNKEGRSFPFFTSDKVKPSQVSTRIYSEYKPQNVPFEFKPLLYLEEKSERAAQEKGSFGTVKALGYGLAAGVVSIPAGYIALARRPGETISAFGTFVKKAATEGLPEVSESLLRNPGGTVGKVIGQVAGMRASPGGIVRGVKQVKTVVTSEKVPASTVLSKQVLFEGKTFPSSPSAEISLKKFLTTPKTAEGKIRVVHATPTQESFTAETIIKPGPAGKRLLEDPGLYVSAYQEASPHFFGISGEDIGFSLLPDISTKTPGLVVVEVSKVSRQPLKVIRAKGFEPSKKFLESQVGTGTAFITKRSELGLTHETESVIPVGSKIVKKETIKPEYFVYEKTVVPIKTFSLQEGKVSSVSFVEMKGEISKVRSKYSGIYQKKVIRPSYSLTSYRKKSISYKFSLSKRKMSFKTANIEYSQSPISVQRYVPSVSRFRKDMTTSTRKGYGYSTSNYYKSYITPTRLTYISSGISVSRNISKKKRAFDFEINIGQTKKVKRIGLRMRTRYVPTLYSAVGQVKMPKGKIKMKELTGLEVRPLT